MLGLFPGVIAGIGAFRLADEFKGLLLDFFAIDGGEEILGELIERGASGLFLDLGFLLGGEVAIDAGEASGEGGDGVGIAGPHDDLHGEVFKSDVGLGDGRATGGLEGLGNANGIDEDVAGLGGLGGGGDFLEVIHLEGAGAAAFHLLEVALGLYVAHEEEAFQGLHVGAGGDHVHGNGDARVVAIAKVSQGGLGVLALDEKVVFDLFLFVVRAEVDFLHALGGAKGDLLAEVVSLVEFLADDVDDVVGVGVSLGEDEGLGDLEFVVLIATVGEDLGKFVPEGSYHGSDLGGIDDFGIEFLG